VKLKKLEFGIATISGLELPFITQTSLVFKRSGFWPPLEKEIELQNNQKLDQNFLVPCFERDPFLVYGN
jgi:hypothetical protein